MNMNIYKVISKFNCCGNTMVTVIIEGRAACVMSELEFNRIIETEKNSKNNNPEWIKELVTGTQVYKYMIKYLRH